VDSRALVIGEPKTLVRAGLDLGAEVHWVQRPGEPPLDDVTGAQHVLRIDYRDHTFVDVIAEMHRSRPFDAVVAISEDALLPCAAINSRLGLRGSSLRTARLLTDKWSMRQHLSEFGVSPVRAALGRNLSDLSDFGTSNGYPFIAKPVAGTGSYGVALVSSESAARSANARFRSVGSPAFLMEEYLDGSEVSVETFSFDGRHVTLTVTDKLVGRNFIEVGHCVPTQLGPEQVMAVTGAVGQFLDAVGLRDGPSHVEVKLTSAGPRIVEGHSRRGGDRINDLVALALDVDMEGLTVAWALDRIEPLTEAPTIVGGAAIRFIAAEPGRVLAVHGVEQAKGCHGVLEVQLAFGEGDRIGPLHWSLNRPGYVIARGRDGRDAAAVADRAASMVHFVMEAGLDVRSAFQADLALSHQLDQSRRLGYDLSSPTRADRSR